MIRFLFFIFIAASLFSSCKFNPNLQGKGADFLQGEWREDSVLYRNELLQYTTHHFKFTCDSFYVTLNTTAETNYYPDSCFNGGEWTEYAKGLYAVRGDSVIISGTFTKSNFKQKISGCYRIGQYLETFIIKDRSAELISLESLNQHRPVQLSLKRRLTCIQKPIN